MTTGYMWRSHKHGDEWMQRWERAFKQPGDVSHHHRVICDCGAWLSLGQANDDDARVRVEIRAAEIAVTWLELRKSQLSSELREICDGAEIAGWIDHRFDSAKVPDQDGEWSGWLAREIHEHDNRPSSDANGREE